MIKIIKEHKIRMIIGLAVAVILAFLSLYFLKGSNVKTYLVCILLSFATGFVIAFPHINLSKKWSIVLVSLLLLVYGLIVPRRVFLRTELFVSDLGSLISGVTFLNICILFFLFFVLLFLLQRTSLALGIEGILVLILALVNYYLTRFRGSGFSFTDIGAIGTAAKVMGEYDYELTPEAFKSIIYMLFFIVLGFRIDFPFKGSKYHICITSAAIVGFCLTLLCYSTSSVWDNTGIKGETGNIFAGEKAYGLFYYLYLTSQATGMEKSLNYSDSSLSEIASEAEASYQPTSGYRVSVQNPNIILIMNEAWSDLRVLGDMETSQEYMPFLDSLKESKNAISGSTYVNIIGGMTCNSEFEALTGDSMAFLNTAAVPYDMQVDHTISSIASVLGAQGYQTVAMHPNSSNTWNRGSVYEYMGFDCFVPLDDFSVELENVGAYTSDECDFNELIYLFENRDVEKPFFAFNVTIQNHSPYYDQTPVTNTVTGINGQSLEDAVVENEYISLMKLSDNALENLITYFENVDEPTIICMFGDHQPILTDAAYEAFFQGSDLSEEEKESLKHRTPYIIWANYDVEMPQYGDISASYLSPILCELAGVELPTYYKFILNFYNELGAFHVYSEFSDEAETIVENYKMLQYNQLMEKAYRKDLFEVE